MSDTGGQGTNQSEDSASQESSNASEASPLPPSEDDRSHEARIFLTGEIILRVEDRRDLSVASDTYALKRRSKGIFSIFGGCCR